MPSTSFVGDMARGNVGALIIRSGLWGMLYHQRSPEIVQGVIEAPHIIRFPVCF